MCERLIQISMGERIHAFEPFLFGKLFCSAGVQAIKLKPPLEIKSQDPFYSNSLLSEPIGRRTDYRPVLRENDACETENGASRIDRVRVRPGPPDQIDIWAAGLAFWSAMGR
jgi:hypothetical protein